MPYKGGTELFLNEQLELRLGWLRILESHCSGPSQIIC